MKKKILSVALALATAVSCIGALGSCKKKSNALTIRYYNGGYGDEWLKNSLEEFCDAKGIEYELIPDNDITYQANLYLERNVPDIIMSNGNWKGYVKDGLIEELSDVYNTKVQTSNGEVAIKDYIDSNVMKQFTRKKIFGREGGEYTWAMPWASQVLSLAYNETILLSTTHKEGNPYTVEGLATGATWTHAPNTVNELMAYLTDVRLANNGITPWGYAVDNLNWYDALFYVWWAELQGLETSNYPGEGCFYDFFNMESPELIKQSGYKGALEAVRKIIVDDNGQLYNSNNDGSMTKEKMQENFAKGNIAVCLVGDFFEKEYKDFMKEDQVIKLMYIPTISEDSEAERMTYVQTDNVMYVPANAEHKDWAKEFLAFLCNEEQLLNFSKTAGVVRPFAYNPYELASDYTWTNFQKSTFDIYYGADHKVIKYPLTATEVSPIYLYENVSLFMGVPAATVFGEFRRTDKPVAEAADRIVELVYEDLKQSFAEWEDYYQL